MPAGTDVGPATLRYVARLVKGKATKERTHFNEVKQRNEKEIVELDDPVIVFFPNRSSLVFEARIAEKNGFFEQPEVLNLAHVEDERTVAGQYKFAMTVEKRAQAFKRLEDNVIARCVQTSGHPLPMGVEFSAKSIYLDEEPRNAPKVKKAQTEVEVA
jgi:hypothetical protein